MLLKALYTARRHVRGVLESPHQFHLRIRCQNPASLRLCRWHTIQLSSALHCRDPLDPLRREELSTGLVLVDEFDIVQDARLDDPLAVDAAKRIAMSEERRSTVSAEMAWDD